MGAFATAEAEEYLLEPLMEAQETLEVSLGLRPARAPEAEEPGEPTREDTSEKVERPIKDVPPEPPMPKVPLRERLWRSLLSERTLHAILFLGIFLLFSAAVSFVIWGWKDFSAPLRVAIPAGFTFLFFTLGWYVRIKTSLHRSAIWHCWLWVS